jgi:hypothetical protein
MYQAVDPREIQVDSLEGTMRPHDRAYAFLWQLRHLPALLNLDSVIGKAISWAELLGRSLLAATLPGRRAREGDLPDVAEG